MQYLNLKILNVFIVKIIISKCLYLKFYKCLLIFVNHYVKIVKLNYRVRQMFFNKIAFEEKHEQTPELEYLSHFNVLYR